MLIYLKIVKSFTISIFKKFYKYTEKARIKQEA